MGAEREGAQAFAEKDPRFSAMKDALDRKKEQILEAHRKSRQEGREAGESGVQDEGDRASSAHAREFIFSLSETERQQLQLVDDRLEHPGVVDERRVGVDAVEDVVRRRQRRR